MTSSLKSAIPSISVLELGMWHVIKSSATSGSKSKRVNTSMTSSNLKSVPKRLLIASKVQEIDFGS